MADNHEHAFEGVSNPAREKTLGERPVSDQDIQEIHEDIEDLSDDLDDLRSKGDQTLPPG